MQYSNILFYYVTKYKKKQLINISMESSISTDQVNCLVLIRSYSVHLDNNDIFINNRFLWNPKVIFFDQDILECNNDHDVVNI